MDKSGKKFSVSDLTKDLHSQFGVFSKNDLRKNKGKIKSKIGKKFSIFPAGFIDKLQKLKRGAQIITLKDAGIIIAETGINKESRIIEAGGGSGALTCIIANIAKQVTTYEIREDFVKIIKENITNLELDNVKVKNKDITKRISERNVDLIVLDLPDPDKVIEHAATALKQGGFLVVYLPSITQVASFVNKIERNENFVLIKVIENIQREWKVHDKIARPEFRMLGHTGFLSFFRKI